MTNHFVAFWNLENLFAPEGYADREPWIAKELASELKGWSQKLFKSKINQLSSIIRQMDNSQGPDILGVCEVENKFALQELSTHLNEQIPNRNYDIVHADSTRDRRGIDTAFIFDHLKVYGGS
jgi:predicted extracellular nuclease